jgi:hemolysin activation/secretion protein
LDSSNAQLGLILANERVRAARLGASYNLTSSNDLILASATISQGIDGLGARTTPGIAVPDFQQVNLNLGYNRLFLDDWVVRVKGTAQLGGERLPTSELLSLGGSDYGRAFAVSTIIGDSGAAGSAELAWHPQVFPIDWLKGSELYVFADRGETWFRQRGFLTSGTAALTSAGFGTRLAGYRDTQIGLEAADQLAAPAVLRKGWAFNLTLKTLQ